MENNVQKNPLNGKKIALFVVYAIVAACLFFTVLSFNDLPSIMEQLKSVNVEYVLLAVLMVLIYMAIYPFSLCILTKSRKCDISMKTTFCIAMIEHFFNGITPLATGGQPFQAHMFSKAKIKISESTGLLLANLLIYQIAATAFSLSGLVYFDVLTKYISPLWIPIIFVGYTLNCFVLFCIVILGTSKKVRDGLMRFIRFLCRFKMMNKLLAPKIDDINEYFIQVQTSFHELTKKKGYFLLALFTKLLALGFLYFSVYFILLSMNVPAQPSHVGVASFGICFAMAAVAFIPTPGASGVAEGSAGQVLKSIILFIVGGTTITMVDPIANGVMLIWRLLSYYLVMAISLLFYFGITAYFSKKQKKLLANS